MSDESPRLQGILILYQRHIDSLKTARQTDNAARILSFRAFLNYKTEIELQESHMFVYIFGFYGR